MKVHLPLISTLLALLMVTAGCFGGGQSEPSAGEATVAPTQASEAATSAPPQATEAATATQAPARDTPISEATAPVAGDAVTALTVEEATGITSYRMHISLLNEGPMGSDDIQIEGAYIKEPPTEQIEISFLQGGQPQSMEMMLVDGTRYVRVGEEWMQTPEAALNVSELTLMTPQIAVDLVGQMELIGIETVNDLSTSHYQGQKEILPNFGTESDMVEVSELDAAQLDLWVDDSYNAIVKLVLEANVAEPPMTATLTYEYTDLNSEIEIVAPEVATTPEESAQSEADFVPANELGALLGFNLMFPTGSTVETVVDDTLYVVVAPFPIEEAPTFIESTMLGNGYSQISKNVGPTGEIVYLFQRDPKAVSVTLTDAGDGNTRFQFATGP